MERCPRGSEGSRAATDLHNRNLTARLTRLTKSFEGKDKQTILEAVRIAVGVSKFYPGRRDYYI